MHAIRTQDGGNRLEAADKLVVRLAELVPLVVDHYQTQVVLLAVPGNDSGRKDDASPPRWPVRTDACRGQVHIVARVLKHYVRFPQLA
eukprot:CAMPEP_0183367920 /NCGR_PEP_ID=MMETSP0164_2-20130417/94087_1 /TAXON_ID=221442 /ORGANISM="Coccolithus pelagicus ssp braarudi, Strain PLY182g" /LENGTH=87 /DNA_ID=CAMNT_0025543925 /DNA_START=837 /DNA_END=1100 /DNA_ORIENTATION=+